MLILNTVKINAKSKFRDHGNKVNWDHTIIPIRFTIKFPNDKLILLFTTLIIPSVVPPLNAFITKWLDVLLSWQSFNIYLQKYQRNNQSKFKVI